MVQTEEAEVSTNGTAVEPAKRRVVRVDRAEQGYAQCLADVRRLNRAVNTGDTKAGISDLLDSLEDMREDGLRIEEIVRRVKAGA